MSKSVLISIRPEWCEKIANRLKTIEVRKNRPKIEPPFKCYIYMTKGNPYVSRLRHNGELGHAIEIENWVGTVIGEFICDGIETIGIPYPAYQNEMRQDVIERSCLSYAELHRYAGHHSLYGWHISDLVIYDKPRELREFYKPGFSSIEDLDEDLCKYCYEKDYGEKKCFSTPNGPVMCEGDYCESAYEAYLEDEGFTLTRPPQSWCYVEEI